MEGKYLLTASMTGYDKAWNGPVVVKAGSSTTLPQLLLRESVEQLNTVTVTGQRPFIEQKADRMVVNVAGSIIASGGTALEVLQRAPGIIIDQDDNINLNGKEGVIVMIDGRRTRMSASEVTALLRNMPSDAVEQVDIITNPSAKYDAEGNSGIIDIRTKKGRSEGLNGTLTAGVGYGRYEKANAGLNLNYRRGRFNWFGNYTYNYNPRFQNLSFDRLVDVHQERINYTSNTFWAQDVHSHGYKAGVDYSINQKHLIGFAFTGFGNRISENGRGESHLSNSRDVSIEDLKTIATGIYNRSNHTYNLNYQHNAGDGRMELSADMEYTLFRGYSRDHITNHSLYPDASLNYDQLIFSTMPTDVDILVGKIDYSKPIPTGNLEFGVKSSWVVTDNDMKFDTLAHENWVSDASKTNHFRYKELINAAYASANIKIGTLSLQGGLRAEHTWYQGNSITWQEVNTREYLKLFPSIFLQYPLGELHQAGLSYSRRIDRPSYQMLNPFVYQLDKYNFSQGNPLLQPQLTDQLQATYVFKKQYNLSLGYSHTTNIYRRVPEVRDENDERYTFGYMRNLDNLYNYNMSLSLPLELGRWWSVQNNLSLFHNRTRGELLNEQLDLGVTSYNINIINRFKLPLNISGELGGNYNSPGIYAAMRTREMWGINAGLKYTFPDKSANISFNITDIFRTMRWQARQEFGGQEFTIRNSWESRVARLTFSYNFGNQEVKPIRRRKNAGEEEQRRLESSQ
ncbi:TonB-dependent receptor [Flammeovirgaceae bacterium 311]|nr:TonB-dependent receptor [Flammeovirgaceae bacterium 311]